MDNSSHADTIVLLEEDVHMTPETPNVCGLVPEGYESPKNPTSRGTRFDGDADIVKIIRLETELSPGNNTECPAKYHVIYKHRILA